MSIVTDAETFTATVKDAAERVVTRTASDLEAVVSRTAADIQGKVEAAYQAMKSNAIDIKKDVQGELTALEATVDSLRKTGNDAIAKVFADAESTVGGLVDSMVSAGKKGVDGLQSASTYLRNGMRTDLVKAITDAKNAIEDAHTKAKDGLTKYANDFTAFIKADIDAFVSKAKTDLANVKADGETFKSTLASHIDSVKGDLEQAKTTMHTDFDRIIAYGKNEFSKLEARAASVASTVNDVAMRAAIFAVVAGAGFFIFTVIRKNVAVEEAEKQR